VSLGPRLALAFALVATATAPRTLAEPPKPAPAKDTKPPKEAKEKEAVHLSADKLDIDVEAKRAVLEGNVRLERGSVTMRAPRFEVRYDDVPNVTWARGTGGVVAEAKGVRAEAPEVELDLAKQNLALKGGVRITRGTGWITADKAMIDLSNGKISLAGVEGVLPVP
jgi:lipopolysaccharide export system protein LptA